MMEQMLTEQCLEPYQDENDVKEVIDIPADRKLKISMAPGGGCAMKIYKKP